MLAGGLGSNVDTLPGLQRRRRMRWIGSMSIAAVLAIACGAGVYADASGVQGYGTATTEKPTQSSLARSREFINKMAIAGMTEIELGKMATERAANAEVKAFGQMMVKDHSQANEQLAQVASQLNVQMPQQLDRTHRDLVDRLSRHQGAQFDREYMAAMVHGHEEVLKELRARLANRLTSGARPSSRGSGPVGTTGMEQGEQALTAWAAKVLPTVEQHLQRAREIGEKVK
jgi:putative membrane protein